MYMNIISQQVLVGKHGLLVLAPNTTYWFPEKRIRRVEVGNEVNPGLTRVVERRARR